MNYLQIMSIWGIAKTVIYVTVAIEIAPTAILGIATIIHDDSGIDLCEYLALNVDRRK